MLVFGVLEQYHVVGIQTDCPVILISVEQVLSDEHDAQVPVVRIFGEQIGHSLVHVVHLVVYDDQVFFCGIQGVEI